MFRLNTMKTTSSQGDTFDLKYIALFKTREEAEAYEFVKGANFITNKTVYNIGEQIDVSYLDTADGDWFGIFDQAADPATATPILRKDVSAADKVQSFTFEGTRISCRWGLCNLSAECAKPGSAPAATQCNSDGRL